jgi:glycine oxidase
VGFDKRVTATGLSTVLQQAMALCPALSEATVVDSWSGLRPWTPDGLPILGKGSLDGLLLASGHYRNGILLAPITARLLAQVARGERPSVDLAPFGAGRFR